MGSVLSSSRNAVVRNKTRVPWRNSQTNELQQEYFVGADGNAKFIDLVKRVPHYKYMVETSCAYDIYISTGKLHWFILIQLNGSSLPFVTIEITRSDVDKVSFLAVMEILQDVTDKQKLKTETTTLNDLCGVADEVKAKMGYYDLYHNNCQHFCNNFLKWLNYEQFPTTTRLWAAQSTLGYDDLGFDAWPAIQAQASRQYKSQD